MKMPKILLTVSNLRSIFGDASAVPGHPHTGVAYLSAFLKSHGVEVDVYDERMDGPERLPQLLKAKSYTAVGVTAFSYSLQNVYGLIRRIKENSSAPVILGGPHVSVAKDTVFNKAPMDFAIMHEGEETALDLLQRLETGLDDWASVPGLIWKKKDGQAVVNIGRPLVQDLDSLPYPDYDAFGIERYPCWNVRSIPFITQRGCPYQCNFCSVPVSMGEKFRYRSPENTVKEMEHWYKRGFRHFQINDDVFNIRRDRVLEICRLIRQKGLDVTWELYNGIRVNVADETLLRAMKEAGCVLVSFGCETGSPRIMKLIEKGCTLEQVKSAVQTTRKVGINCSVNFIVGHPTETREEAMETYRFAKSLPANFINFYNDVPYPGTRLWEWVRDHARLLQPDFLEDVTYHSGEIIYDTPEFTREERLEVLGMGHRLYEKSMMTYRMGPALGTLVFHATRFKLLHWIGRNFVYSTRLGRWLFSKLSLKFGGMVWVR